MIDTRDARTGTRNVRFDPRLPPAQWPAEAIEALLDRGALSDWRRLALEIRRDPWGRVARIVETVASWKEHYGADQLMREVISEARERLVRAGRERYAAQIRAWRAQTGLGQREFALAAGTSAPRLSDYERAKVAPTTDVLARLEHAAGIHARADESDTRGAGASNQMPAAERSASARSVRSQVKSSSSRPKWP